jgi:hypothetical protein
MKIMGWLGVTVVLMLMLIGFEGCTGEGMNREEPNTQARIFWLDAPAEARLGQTVPLKLTWKNVTDRPVKLALSGRPAYDFVVTTPDGREIWRWRHGQATLQILEIKTLNPGEELKGTADWQQVNNAGQPVPPGRYLVRGFLNIDPPKKLETKSKRLIIASK